MKSIIHSLAACTLLTLGACSNAEEAADLTVPTPKVEIKLGSSVAGVESRAAIAVGQNITAQLLGREGNENGGWQAAAHAWSSNATFTTATAATTVRMVDKQYYNNDNAETHTYVLGIYPTGTLQNNKVTLSTRDGLQDVLLSAWTDAGCKSQYVNQEGNEITPGASQPAELQFKHATAQIYFEANLANNSADQGFAGTVTLESITLRSACLPAEVDATVPTVNFTDPTNLAIPGINAKTLYTTAARCGQPVMVNASGEIKVDITIRVNNVPKVFNDVLITKEGGQPLATEIGKRHKVALTFKAPEKPAEGAVEINVSASITDWVDGDSGSTTLQ